MIDQNLAEVYFITGLECDVMIADKNETSSSRIPI